MQAALRLARPKLLRQSSHWRRPQLFSAAGLPLAATTFGFFATPAVLNLAPLSLSHPAHNFKFGTLSFKLAPRQTGHPPPPPPGGAASISLINRQTHHETPKFRYNSIDSEREGSKFPRCSLEMGP
jgi:hypothetical protein